MALMGQINDLTDDNVAEHLDGVVPITPIECDGAGFPELLGNFSLLL